MITDIILIIGVVWAIFQLKLLVIRLLGGKNRFDWYVLNSSCLFLIGFVFHFGFGFPLDEGTIDPSKIEEFEFRLIVADFVLFSGVIYPILWPVRVALRWLEIFEKR